MSAKDGKDGKKGTSADDTLFGTNKADTISGRGGNDTIASGDGNDKVFGGSGNDWIDAGNGNDKVFGGSGNDTIYAGSGDDKVHGGKGDDTIYGDAGHDHIKGGSGDDSITGGAGADKLTGNSGNDHFIYLANSDSPAGSGSDRITDFTQGADKIDLAALLGSTDLAWGNTTATANGAWYQNSGSSTFVYADTDGNSTADLKIELEHTRGLNLTVDDFIGVSDAPQGNTAPLAVADNVITNIAGDNVVIPEWALLGNDSDPDGDTLDIASVDVGNPTSGDQAVLTPGTGTDGFVTFLDNDEFTASFFTYVATDGQLSSGPAVVGVTQDMDGTIDGTSGNDILVGAQFEASNFVGNGGNDIMFGGDFSDTFDYNALSDRGTTGDIISGFQKGLDNLDLSDLLSSIGAPHDMTAFSNGFLQFDQSGGSTQIQIDSDGGANSFVTLATLSGVLLNLTDTGDFIL